MATEKLGVDPDATPQLAKSMVPSTFGIAPGRLSTAKFELNQMPCLRWSHAGTRAVVLVDGVQLLKYLSEKKQERASKLPSIAELQNWAQHAEADEWQKFVDATKAALWCGTLGPKDCLFSPAGAICFHRVLNADDVLGVRLGILTCHDVAAYTNMLSANTAIGQTNLVMQQAFDCMKAMPPPFGSAPAEQPAGELQAQAQPKACKEAEQAQARPTACEEADNGSAADGGGPKLPGAAVDSGEKGSPASPSFLEPLGNGAATPT